MISNWQTKKLGDVCDILDNKRKPVTKRDRTAGQYPYYGATGILDYVNKYLFDEKLILIGEDGAKWGSGEYTAFIADGKYWVNNHAHVIRPHHDIILDNWIVYFFYLTDITEYTTGLTVPKLNQANLRNIQLPLPPLSEQQHLLKKLDEVFEKTVTAKHNAGKNLQNARELYESYLEIIFAQSGKDWVEKTLGDVCSLYQGIAINAKTKHALVEKSDLPLLRIKDLKNNTVEQYIDPNNYPVNALVNESDIIYTRTGSLGLVFRGRKGVLHNNSFKVVPNSELDKDYLFIWLQNPIFKSKIMNLALKAAQPDITHAIFKVQKIIIPPISEQKSIVVKLDAISGEIKKLEAIYTQKLSDLEELKKSVLQKAFAGEL